MAQYDDHRVTVSRNAELVEPEPMEEDEAMRAAAGRKFRWVG